MPRPGAGSTGIRPLAVLLTAAALNLAACAVVLVRFPVIFAAERRVWVLVDVVLLFVYAGFAVAVVRWADGSLRNALPQATWLGLAAGAVQGADIAREYLLDVGPGTSFAIGVGAFVVILACFWWAGTRACGDLRRGALAGVWTAMTAMLTLWLIAWLLDYAFAARLAQILVGDPEYTRGNTLFAMPAYVYWNTFSAAASHAPVLPVLGAALGAAGAWCASFAGRTRLRDQAN